MTQGKSDIYGYQNFGKHKLNKSALSKNSDKNSTTK